MGTGSGGEGQAQLNMIKAYITYACSKEELPSGAGSGQSFPNGLAWVEHFNAESQRHLQNQERALQEAAANQ